MRCAIWLLLALSLAHQGRLVTFDRGIRQLVPDRSSLLAAIVLIDGS